MNVSICEVTNNVTLIKWLCDPHRAARSSDPATTIRDAWPKQHDAHVRSWLGLTCNDCTAAEEMDAMQLPAPGAW